MTYTAPQYVEQFHLLFLDQLGRKLDKRSYALKGGCNLRFYFKSLRYSEDMDLDVRDVTVHELREKVRKILRSRPFIDILQVKGITLQRISESKQTKTTQRWKLGLRILGSEVTLPTKIEFSKRGMSLNTRFEAIDPEIIRTYQLSPIMANHYPAQAAFEQKLSALASRNAIQARDIFDLHLLLGRGVKTEEVDERLKGRLEEAKTNTLGVTFDVFKGQVLSFLSVEHQAQYDSAAVWESMVLEVVEALNEAVA